MHSKMKEMLKQHEGYVDHAYKCPAGYWTIGYGHNLEAHGDVGPRVIRALNDGEMEIRVSRKLADQLLDETIDQIESALSSKVFYCALNSDPIPQGVLINMAFNMGVTGLLSFKNMTAALSQRDFEAAYKHGLDSKWARDDVPYRAQELMCVMRTGVI